MTGCRPGAGRRGGGCVRSSPCSSSLEVVGHGA